MAVDKLVDSTQLDADLTSVANAIRTKGSTSEQMAFPAGFVSAVNAIPTGVTPTGTKQISITENGTVTEDVTNYADAEITVNVQGGGGETVESKDVDFIDYDGTIVASYTAQEFLALTEMPGNPAHSGLTSQGWNWTLAEAKEYVQNHGGLIIGQMYIPSDGKTKIKIHLDADNLSPYCGFGINGTAVIEWGDGTSDTVTGTDANAVVNTQHTYASAGDYTISIGVTGSLNILGVAAGTELLWDNNATQAPNSKVYRTAIREVNIGSNVGFYGNYSFANCFYLEVITMPQGFSIIGTGLTFQNCFSLQCVILPMGLTGTTSNMCISCESLRVVSLPYGLINCIANSFTNCHSIDRLYIPDNGSVFGGSTGMSGLKTLGIPNGVTEMPAFSAAYSLRRLPLPSSLIKFAAAALMNCWGLENITIPSGVTDIAANAFSTCQSMQYIKFEGSTPPTIAASTAFASLPTSCKILVPTGSLTAYTGATNYPSAATYTYVEY